MDTLTRLAREFGLKRVMYTGFHEFYEQEITGAGMDSPSRDLFNRMRVLDQEGTISEDQWEAIGVYSCFCFQKM